MFVICFFEGNLMLQNLYQWVLRLSEHRHATFWLVIVAFAESSFFPLPPDPIFIAMILACRERAFYLATLCMLSSVVGGWLGYAIGYGLYEAVGRVILDSYGLSDSFQKLQEDFNHWGFWIVALKGLTPIPYKVVTIAAGVAKMDLWTFTSASFIARGFRFYLLAILLWYYGAPIKIFIERNLALVTTTGVAFLVGGFFVVKFFG